MGPVRLLARGLLGRAGGRATVPFSELADFFLRLNADVTADDVAYKNLPVQGIDTGGPAAYRVDTEAAAELVADLLPDALRKPGPNSKVRVLVQNGVGSPGVGPPMSMCTTL